MVGRCAQGNIWGNSVSANIVRSSSSPIPSHVIRNRFAVGHAQGAPASRAVLDHLVAAGDRISNPESCAEAIKGANKHLYALMQQHKAALGIATARDALKEAQERHTQEIDRIRKDHARALNEAESRLVEFEKLFGSDAKSLVTVD